MLKTKKVLLSRNWMRCTIEMVEINIKNKTIKLLIDQWLFWLDSYSPVQNIWNKIEKSSKIGHDKKSLMSTFACVLTTIAKVKFCKGDWALVYVSTLIWDFSNISWFSKILSLKSFTNSWGNSYTKFAILDFKFCFTCDKWDLY